MRSGRLAASRLTCIAVAILVLVSCASEPGGDRSADPSLSTTLKATSTSNADRRATLKAPFQMSSTSSVPVADSQLHVIFRYPPLLDPNLLASPLAVTSVGKLIAYEAPLPDGEKLKHGLVVVTGESGRVTQELPERSTVRQVVVATSFGESVVWRETASTSLDYEDYQISVMTAGAAPKVIANSSGITPPGMVLPTTTDSERDLATDGHTVFFTAGLPVEPGARLTGTEIRAVPIAGGANAQGTVVATNHVFPFFTGTETLAIGAAGPMVAATQPLQVAVIGEGQPPRARYLFSVDGPETVRDACGTADYVAVAVSTHAVEVGAEPASRVLIFTPAHGSEPLGLIRGLGDGVHLACGDAFLAWGNGSGNGDAGQYILDFGTSTIAKLGEAYGASMVYGAGSYIAWTELNPELRAPVVKLARWLG